MTIAAYILAAWLALAALGSLRDSLEWSLLLAVLAAALVYWARRRASQGNLTAAASGQQDGAAGRSRLPAGDFATVAAESGFFVSPMPKWLVEAAETALANQSESPANLERDIRKTGTLLTADEKRALGINTRAKVGKDFIESLSPLGLEQPLDALFICLMRCSGARSVQDSIEQAAATGIVTCLELVTVEDDRTCEAARARSGEKFALADAPSLPLAGCDAPWCRCSLVASAD